jgi:mycothiol maleylpyruvate isomerase-like protein
VDRDELLRREDEAWSGFAAEVDRVPEDRREADGAVEGWSVKDLVWHCAYWAGFCGDVLASLRSPDFTDPFAEHDDAYWDVENARVAEEGKSKTWGEVMERADEARRSVRDAFQAAPVGDKPAEWFGEETFEHYDEHAEHIRSFSNGS